ncbi:MAG: hypothetical protein KF841_04425 [Phycisphaerae bacterium]|nr:hypothetical protein [Phycisphaerae bacterium]
MSSQAFIEFSESESVQVGRFTSAGASVRFDEASTARVVDRLRQASQRLRAASVMPGAAIVMPTHLAMPRGTAAPHPFPPQATHAIEWVRTAAEAGFRMLIVREPRLDAASDGGRRIEDEHANLLRVLQAIRFDAEMLGLRIAVSVGHEMLGTPAMAREFIDDCNSAWVGGCVCLNDPSVTSRPTDWVNSLGRRLFAIRIVGGITPAQRDALRTIRRLVAPSDEFVISVRSDALLDDLNEWI